MGECITYPTLTVEGCNVIWVRGDGSAPEVFDLTECFPEGSPSVVTYDADACEFTHTNGDGDAVTVPLNHVEPRVNDNGDLVLVVCGEEFVYSKPTLAYDADTHVLNYDGEATPLNVGVMGFDAATCVLSYTDEQGEEKTWTIPQDSFTHDPDACLLTIVPAKGADPIVVPLGAQTKDVDLTLVDDTLTLKYKDKEVNVSLPRYTSALEFDAATCGLTFIDANGNEQSWTIPQDSFTYDADTCALAISAAKDDTPIIVPLGAQAKDVDLTLTGNTLTLSYKDKTATVTLPVAETTASDTLAYDADNCMLSVTHGDGSAPTHIPLGAPANKVGMTLEGNQLKLVYKDKELCAALPDAITSCQWDPKDRELSFCHASGVKASKFLGASSVKTDVSSGTITHVSANGNVEVVDVCALAAKCKPVVTVYNNSDGSQTVVHNDGYGVTKTWATQPTAMEVESLPSINGSVITFISDGQSVQMDLCEKVGTHCNATFTELSPTGFAFVDNAGTTQSVTFPTYVKSLCQTNAAGNNVNGTLDANGKATLPYEVMDMRCETADGDFLAVEFEDGVYTIPYKEPEPVEHPTIRCEFPDGSLETLEVVDGVITIPYKAPQSIHIVSNDEPAVNSGYTLWTDPETNFIYSLVDGAWATSDCIK